VPDARNSLVHPTVCELEHIGSLRRGRSVDLFDARQEPLFIREPRCAPFEHVLMRACVNDFAWQVPQSLVLIIDPCDSTLSVRYQNPIEGRFERRSHRGQRSREFPGLLLQCLPGSDQFTLRTLARTQDALGILECRRAQSPLLVLIWAPHPTPNTSEA